MSAFYEIYKDARGGYRWRLKGGNGEIVASGESYTTKANAQNAVAWVRANAAAAPVRDLAA